MKNKVLTPLKVSYEEEHISHPVERELRRRTHFSPREKGATKKNTFLTPWKGSYEVEHISHPVERELRSSTHLSPRGKGATKKNTFLTPWKGATRKNTFHFNIYFIGHGAMTMSSFGVSSSTS